MAFFRDENGQGMVEYGLIVALISILALAALVLLGRAIRDTYFNPINRGLEGTT